MPTTWFGCSDRPVEPSASSSGDLELNLKLSSSELADYIDSVRVIIIPADGSKRVVVSLPVVNGTYEGVIPGVPVGPALKMLQVLAQAVGKVGGVCSNAGRLRTDLAM